MVRRNGFISLTGLMLALGLLLLYLGLGLTAGQRSRSHQAVDGLAREMALDMQQVRQRCVGNNQSNGHTIVAIKTQRRQMGYRISSSSANQGPYKERRLHRSSR